METILDCIQEIPNYLKKNIDKQNKLFDFLSEELIFEDYKKIVIVASGSSNNAGFAAKNFGQSLLSIDIELIYPNIFVNALPKEMLNKNTLYIFVSQGGETKLVLDAVKKVNSIGADTLSITEKLNSSIAREAKVAVEMGSENEPFIFRTIGYSTSILTLSQIFMYLAKTQGLITEKEVDSYTRDALLAINNLPTIFNETLKWYEENAEFLATKNHYIFSGTNDLWPIAVEADIKFMEMIPVLSNSFELEELIHGPQNMFREDHLIFLLAKDNIGREKAEKIAVFIQNEVGNSSVVVSNNTVDTPQLLIDSKSENFYNLEYTTIFQILAYKLGDINNRDYSQGVYPKIVNYISK